MGKPRHDIVSRDLIRGELDKLKREHQEYLELARTITKSTPIAMKLHLELDLYSPDEEELCVLRKYGKMKEGITRDFIVPGTMTLHALHFAIMRAFGWNNSHLHKFTPYEDEFKKMTDGGLVKEWIRQVGMHFRFPGDDFKDIYWDNDYEEWENPKTWMKSKYCGPYYYDGVGEHYIPAQTEADKFREKYPSILEMTTDQRDWPAFMESECDELLERQLIRDVLRVPQTEMNWDDWKKRKEMSLRNAEKIREFSGKKYERLMCELDDVSKKAGETYDKNGNPTEATLKLLDRIDSLEERLGFLYAVTNPEPVSIPALSALCYEYDYGDGWKIRITCTNAWFNHSEYEIDEEKLKEGDDLPVILKNLVLADASGNQADGLFANQLKDLVSNQKPVCVDWDGINLIDDVGGISGFCGFLRTIHGNNQEEKQSIREWARSRGWTGRMPKTENIL